MGWRRRKPGHLYGLPEHGQTDISSLARVRCESLIPGVIPRPFLAGLSVDIPGLEPDPKMDSFELNKILGAILGTCLVLLVTNFAAQALFAPESPEKPGFEIAVKEAATAAARKAAPRCAVRADREAAADRLRRKGRRRGQEMRAPATPSRRAAQTASVRISTASSASQRGEGRRFNFSAAMKAKGGTWTVRRTEQVHRQPEGLHSGHRDGLCRHPEGQRARRRDRLSAHAFGESGSAADGVEVTAGIRPILHADGQAIAWPFAYSGLAVVIGTFRRSRPVARLVS